MLTSLVSKAPTRNASILNYQPQSYLFSNFAGIILAGGMATRLSAINWSHPKALTPLGGKPLLTCQIEQLQQCVPNIIIAGGWLSDLFNRMYNECNISIVADENIGTGNAFVEAISSELSEHLVVVNADTINDVNLERVLSFHLKHQNDPTATIVLTRRSDAQNSNAFAVDYNGVVIRSFEDGMPGVAPHVSALWHGASTGIIVIPRKLLKRIYDCQFISLEKHIIPSLIRDNNLIAFDNSERISLDIGTPQRLQVMHEKERELINLYTKVKQNNYYFNSDILKLICDPSQYHRSRSSISQSARH